MRNAAGVIQGTLVASDLRAAGEAGGFITHIDMHPDGTKLIAGDTLQPLVCTNADPVWKQVLVTSKKPSGFQARSYANANAGKRDTEGCTGAAIAPSDSSRWYLCQEAVILVCTGRGATVTLSPQKSYTSLANSGAPRIAGPYLIVHPTDANRVMWGVQEGMVFSIDGFATDKALATDVPATTVPGAQARMVLVGFDPSNPDVAYAHSWGNGLYRCANARTDTPTFAAVAGFPTQVKRMRIGPDGTVWATSQDGTLWQLKAGTVKRITGFSARGDWHDIAIDPANAQRVILVGDSGYATMTSNGGTNWTDAWYGNYPAPVGIYVNAVDVPYVGGYAGGFDLSAVLFDPSAQNKLYAVQGVGVMWTNFPTTFSWIDWYTQDRGIRQLIPYSAISPLGGKPLWSGQDRPIFKMRDNLDQSALNYGPRKLLTDGSPSINHGWHLTMSPQDPNYILAQVNYQSNISGYSIDGGDTFTPFPNKNCPDGQQGGCMAVSANKDEIICASGNNGAY